MSFRKIRNSSICILALILFSTFAQSDSAIFAQEGEPYLLDPIVTVNVDENRTATEVMTTYTSSYTEGTTPPPDGDIPCLLLLAQDYSSFNAFEVQAYCINGAFISTTRRYDPNTGAINGIDIAIKDNTDATIYGAVVDIQRDQFGRIGTYTGTITQTIVPPFTESITNHYNDVGRVAWADVTKEYITAGDLYTMTLTPCWQGNSWSGYEVFTSGGDYQDERFVRGDCGAPPPPTKTAMATSTPSSNPVATSTTISTPTPTFTPTPTATPTHRPTGEETPDGASIPPIYLPVVRHQPLPTPTTTPTPTQIPILTSTPTSTRTPARPAFSQVYVVNNTGGQLCYEVFGTGIGNRCFSSGSHFYGEFAADSYRYRASSTRCGSKEETDFFAAQRLNILFECRQGATVQSAPFLQESSNQ